MPLAALDEGASEGPVATAARYRRPLHAVIFFAHAILQGRRAELPGASR